MIVLLHIHLVLLLLLLRCMMREITALLLVTSGVVPSLITLIIDILLHVCTMAMMSRYCQKLIIVFICKVESNQLSRSVRA